MLIASIAFMTVCLIRLVLLIKMKKPTKGKEIWWFWAHR